MFSANDLTLHAIGKQEAANTMRHSTLAQCTETFMKTACLTTSTSFSCQHSIKIARVGRDRDRTLMFRGWSRLCLHAASISAAEGVSAAATAAARAARAEAMKTETTAAAEKAEAWKRAAAASAEAAASKEQAQRQAVELAQREEAPGQMLRQQREHRAKALVRRSGSVHFLHSSSLVFCANEFALRGMGM